jgi:hypothetical protein
MSRREQVLQKLTVEELEGIEPIYDKELVDELVKYGYKITRKGTLDRRGVTSKKAMNDINEKKKSPNIRNIVQAPEQEPDIEVLPPATLPESDTQLPILSPAIQSMLIPQEGPKNIEDRMKDSMSKFITETIEDIEQDPLFEYTKILEDMYNRHRKEYKEQIKSMRNKIPTNRTKKEDPSVKNKEEPKKVEPVVIRQNSKKVEPPVKKTKEIVIEEEEPPSDEEQQEEYDDEEIEKVLKSKTAKLQPQQKTETITNGGSKKIVVIKNSSSPIKKVTLKKEALSDNEVDTKPIKEVKAPTKRSKLEM